ncbi:MAG: pyridoxal phosphate-dependent aminotransferase [Candidatus Aenigmarchaeota archaeon]|nr:pyridoxal phosphate-dependent aminotransferase [Candidatus Aenigmarchaeota archaeon]
MKHRLAERTKVIGMTKIEESLRIIEQHPDIISLGAGEPDFPAPPNVIKSAEKFLERGYTHYSPLQGRLELREELVKKLKKDNGIHANPDEIIVTCGSKEAILLTVLSLVNPKEEVVIPDPGYIAYRPIVELIGGIAKSLPLREEDGFEVHPEILKKSITRKTKLIIINTPSNPTGTVLSKKILEEVADIAIDKNLMIMSDEAYEKLIYDNSKHVSIGSLNGMQDRVITIQSFSKTYAMCGFRVGYAVANTDLIKEMKEFKICTTLAAPTFAQLAAVEALKNSSNYTKMMLKQYDRRRKLIVKRLNEIPRMSCTVPKGAFYAFPNIKNYKMSSDKFSDFLLKKAKVVGIPGTEFGKYGEGYIRFSYVTAYKRLVEALNRIENSLRKL